MNDRVSATAGALFKGADTVASSRETLKGDFSTLRSQVEGMAARWTGGGGGAFQKLMLTYDNEARRVTDALNGLEDALRRTKKQFDVAEAEASAHMNKFAGRLGGPTAV